MTAVGQKRDSLAVRRPYGAVIVIVPVRDLLGFTGGGIADPNVLAKVEKTYPLESVAETGDDARWVGLAFLLAFLTGLLGPVGVGGAIAKSDSFSIGRPPRSADAAFTQQGTITYYFVLQ